VRWQVWGVGGWGWTVGVYYIAVLRFSGRRSEQAFLGASGMCLRRVTIGYKSEGSVAYAGYAFGRCVCGTATWGWGGEGRGGSCVENTLLRLVVQLGHEVVCTVSLR